MLWWSGHESRADEIIRIVDMHAERAAPHSLGVVTSRLRVNGGGNCIAAAPNASTASASMMERLCPPRAFSLPTAMPLGGSPMLLAALLAVVSGVIC